LLAFRYCRLRTVMVSASEVFLELHHMTSWLDAHKPIASSRLQLWLAGAMWSTVGTGLLLVGTWWLTNSAGYQGLIMAAAAISLGYIKSRLVLDRTANRVASRIQIRGEGHCLGGFLSPKSWAVVAVMMVLGRLLRTMPLPRSLLGLVYAAVGTGLLVSSLRIWRIWKENRPTSPVDNKLL
jgi:hypothetical protein